MKFYCTKIISIGRSPQVWIGFQEVGTYIYLLLKYISWSFKHEKIKNIIGWVKEASTFKKCKQLYLQIFFFLQYQNIFSNCLHQSVDNFKLTRLCPFPPLTNVLYQYDILYLFTRAFEACKLRITIECIALKCEPFTFVSPAEL